MAERRDLLIEIGTEELPPKALRSLSDAFTAGMREGLEHDALDFLALRPYATPRRLAVLVQGLIARQPDRVLERRGPALGAAFGADGAPTRAAEGFARSCKVAVDDLEHEETEKGAWLVFRSTQPGQPAGALVPGIVEEALARLPIPKRMRWGALEEEFVRPVHWVVLLFGSEVLDATILGQQAGRHTRGHRFHHPEPLYLAEPRDYAPLLEREGHVLADFDARREAIRTQVVQTAAAAGGTAVIDEALLDEVTALVEWPVPIMGAFDPQFLQVPHEALISTMKGNQKYFHVVDAQGILLPRFIAVSNIESRDPDQVRAGNERVVRPRLSDAAFFWEQDRRRALGERLADLKSVVFQDQLGTLYDKTLRLERLAQAIAPAAQADPAMARRAARLAKCDLLSSMVGEFPELQGIMGRYYAAHDGEPVEVAQAIDRAVSAALRRRPPALQRLRSGSGARRPPRYPGGHFRHRPAPERRQGSLWSAPRGAGGVAHRHRGTPGAEPGRCHRRRLPRLPRRAARRRG